MRLIAYFLLADVTFNLLEKTFYKKELKKSEIYYLK